MLAILRGLIDFCWSIFKWALAIGVIGAVVVAVYLYQRVDEQIRRYVEAKLASHYVGLKVTVRAAEIAGGREIEIRDLSISEPGAQGPPAELLHVEQMRLSFQADLNLQEMLLHDPEVTRVLLRRMTLRGTRRPDNTWSVAKLLPLPKFNARAPAVVIESGLIEICDPLKTPASTFTLRDINLALAPPEPPAAPGAASMRRLQGTLAADLLRQVKLDGWVDPQGQIFDLGGAIESLEISSELRDALPSTFCERLVGLETFRGQADLTFRVGYRPTEQVPFVFQGSGRLVRGRLDDPRLPHPLTEIQAAFQFTNGGFVVDNLSAKSGPSDLRLSCRRAGFGWDSPLWLRAEIQQLELDRQLVDALPEGFREPLRRQWNKYLPAGQINADLTLNFDGRAWTPDLSLRCLDASFAYDKFPYRLEHTQGTLQLKGDQLTASLTAFAGSQPVQILAEARSVTATPYGWVKVWGEDLQLDERLFSALSPMPKPQEVVRSLDPRGTIDVSALFERRGPNEPLHRDVLIKVNRGSIRYAKFPYPLNNIRGTIQLLDDRWKFTDLVGTNDTGIVTCNGDMTPTPEGSFLSLAFTGQNIPLEEELRDALRPSLQQLWNSLKPQGTVDLSEVQVTYLPGGEPLKVSFRAEPRENTSIEPSMFPYRLEKLRGNLWYNDGRARWEQMKAEHGDTKVSIDGFCELLADGGWRLHLENVSMERVRADRDLIQAMPESLRKGVLGLNPSRPCNLYGTIDLARAGHPEAPLTSQWNLDVQLQQAGIDFGLKLENLCGNVRLSGQHNGQRYFCRGELGIDSLTCRDVQLTEVRGPIWFDDRQILLGTAVDQALSDPANTGATGPAGQRRPVMARLFGGKALTSAHVALGEIPAYEVHTELVQADLSQAALETVPGQQRLQGKIWATADLQGAGRSLANLSGAGRLALRDANVYELPVMIALLKLLRIQEPNTNAFSSSDMNFRIVGNHVYFDPINFSGDAISLEGNGDMDFVQSTLQMTFRAMLGRTEERIPVISNLLGGASEQILLIRVNGTLKDPVVTKDPFPGVNQALQQLQGDLQAEKRPQGILGPSSWLPGRLSGKQ